MYSFIYQSSEYFDDLYFKLRLVLCQAVIERVSRKFKITKTAHVDRYKISTSFWYKARLRLDVTFEPAARRLEHFVPVLGILN